MRHSTDAALIASLIYLYNLHLAAKALIVCVAHQHFDMDDLPIGKL